MALPQFVCEIAFGNNPGDASPTWTNVSSDLRGFSISRGRQYELNQMEAGTATITLKNLLRNYDPLYASSPYYPNVVPLVPIRISAILSSTTYRLFTGFVERWPQQRQGPTYAEVQISAVDGFELLTNALLTASSYPQELSGTRIARVLDAVSWSSSARNIAAGQSQISAYTFASADNVQALQHLQDVEQSELGWFFCAGDGQATFFDRHTLIGSTSSGTFSDKPSVDAGSVGYADIVASLDKDLITNDWIGTRDGGVTQEAIDSSMVTKYFLRSQTRTPLLTTDTDVMGEMQYLLSLYKSPARRVQSITIKPGNDTTRWTHVLARVLGDRITIREHPPGGGSANVQDSLIQQINLSLTTDGAAAQCTWGLLPVNFQSLWILNDTTYSKLGTTTILSF